MFQGWTGELLGNADNPCSTCRTYIARVFALNSAVSGNAVFTVAFECTAPYHADALREGSLRVVLCAIAAISLTSFANEAFAAEVAHAARGIFHCLTYGSGDARQG